MTSILRMCLWILVVVALGCTNKRQLRYFDQCEVASECETGVCSQGICTKPCVNESDCGANGQCVDQICKPLPITVNDGDALSIDAGGAGEGGTVVDSCTESPCKLVGEQCGCLQGQGCYQQGTERVCHTAGGQSDTNDCTQDFDCEAGLMCLTGLLSGSSCTPYCDPEVPTSCPSQVCIPSGKPGVGACMAACDPIGQTGCGDRKCAIVAHDIKGFVTACGTVPGKNASGDKCATTQDCGPGLVCASDGACRPICRVATSEGCSTGKCTVLVPTLMVGKIVYGACIP